MSTLVLESFSMYFREEGYKMRNAEINIPCLSHKVNS
jgi:hypothetical protein